jgi:hypothetical protein
MAALLLAGCQAAPAETAKTDTVQPPAANYDLRYAFRVPGDRIAAVQESHAKGCEQLGPSRCRITALKYGVDDHNQASAVLTLTLDPAIARAFGKAATDTAVKARGALVSAEVLDDPATGSVPARLRRAAEEAEAKLKDATDPDERAKLSADAARARAAVATIADLDRSNGPLLATAPVLISYDAGNGSGVGGASFQGAGDALMMSLAGLATILAGIGPWLVLLIGGALLLRLIIPREEPAPAPVAKAEEPGMLDRLFHRHETAPDEPKREDA